MIHLNSARRAVVGVAAVIPELMRRAYERAEDERTEHEKHLATLAHAPSRRDALSAHLCDLALAVATPPLRVPARDALRKVVYDVVRGTPVNIDDDELP